MSEKKKRDYWKEGVPAFWWPSLITSYALIERILGGLGISRFYDLTTNPNGNWITGFLATSLTAFVANKWVNKSEERKANPKAAQSDQPPTG